MPISFCILFFGAGSFFRDGSDWPAKFAITFHFRDCDSWLYCGLGLSGGLDCGAGHLLENLGCDINLYK